MHFLLDLMDIILEKNYFQFENQFYYQVKGVAMKKVSAPSITNLFMAQLEKEFINNAASNPFFEYSFTKKTFG